MEKNHTERVIRICHIAHGDLWAGAEVQLATLLSALRNDPRLSLRAIVLRDGRLACEIRRLGIDVSVLSEENYNPGTLLLKVTSILRQYRPDILHTHKYKDNIIGSVAAVAAGVPNVVRIVHGLTEPFRGISYIKMLAYEWADRLVTAVKVKKLIAVSLDIENALRRRYGLHNVVQIHNGINLEQIKICREREKVRAELGLQPDDWVIGTVGRLTPVKGHHILLQGISRLIAQHNGHIKGLIVGEGPARPSLTKLIKDLRLEKSVILAGHRDDVYDLINSMDIFALPSIHEGIPMVILEAMALYRPVVASRVGGIPEVVEDKISGLLIAPGDTHDLTARMNEILNDPVYASSLARAGRSRVEEKFTATIMAQKTAELYMSLSNLG